MTTLTALFLSTSLQFNLPTELLSSLCYVESHHKVDAIHHDDGHSDSLGVCQIKHKTAQWLGFKGTIKDLMDPKTNVHYAGKYLSYQIKRYKGDIIKAVIAYNMGNAKNLTSTTYSTKVIKEWRSTKDVSYYYSKQF